MCGPAITIIRVLSINGRVSYEFLMAQHEVSLQLKDMHGLTGINKHRNTALLSTHPCAFHKYIAGEKGNSL